MKKEEFVKEVIETVDADKDLTLMQVLDENPQFKESKVFILAADSTEESDKACCAFKGDFAQVMQKFGQIVVNLFNGDVLDEDVKKAVAMSTLDLIVDASEIDVKEWALLRMLR